MTEKTEKTIELSVSDRFVIPALFPEKGDFVEMLIAKHLERRIEFTPDQVQSLKFVQGDRGITWNKAGDQPFAIELTEQELLFLQKQITRLSEAKELLYSYMPFCEKIMNL